MISDHCEGIETGRHDVCIIGAGPAGLSLALELRRLGLSALILESGGARPEPSAQDLSGADLADPARHDDMSIAVARRLGGTSNLWGGRCLPFDPVDFRPRPGMPDWPIGLADLAPFLPTACRFAACGEPVFEAPMAGVAVEDDAFSVTRLERWSGRPRFQVSHADALASDPLIDIRLHATVVDIRFDESGAARAVVVARPSGERRTVPVARLVLAAGGLETTRLLLALQRRRPALFGGPDGPLGRTYMGHVIGEIADVTFASDAIDAAFDFQRDPEGYYVRRRFVPSPALQAEHDLLNVAFWPVIPRMADAGHRDAFLSLAFLALSFDPVGRVLLPDALRVRHVPKAVARWPHLRNVGRNLPAALVEGTRVAWQRYAAATRLPGLFVRNAGRRYGLSYHSEQSPRAESRVRLGDRTDATGLPRLHIDYRVHEDDARAVVRAHDLFAGWLARTGLGRLEYRQPAERNVEAVMRQSGHGTHQIGTVRMADAPGRGVVDRNLRVFDASNLYVASAAVLPRSGQATPTLTVVALAVRLAHHIAAEAARVEVLRSAA
ncbi:GMC oxidoreductase [Methylobacterium nonmethylotrophicum]|uniref:GMC family oxidoreductase n=1 Tax=Methylobacterium nonmethylotrophicum TaxID=1141884 RepID=A0A4Z0NYN5_9HYPH|nr:GMC oxidoreductase [Methylobacterium nonmethylotrophicum]TGE02594.1 GMC family oxidoreductase [Methylobacterium nonmethylotrophicum]